MSIAKELNLNPSIKDSIETCLGVYDLALITENCIYYSNDEECDENACVIMFDKEGNQISNNYFAYGAFMEDLQDVIFNNKKHIFAKEGLLEEAKRFLNDNN